ncbi:hypothetical protein J2T55_002153 [Methylohalomonas lacus]|uniref:Uncharacterized protein n=1 Tax=Methylohalomonas lacus TaxID=398773 RepID=A0AAE3L1V2_9GAMM|nr:hypothetical protein [Methylohalomonas lacus]MCS3904120.1 hypothetical protein [Methylohalomonas lacus]
MTTPKMDVDYTIFRHRLTTVLLPAGLAPRQLRRLLLVTALMALLAGCAAWQPVPRESGGETAACLQFYADFDRAVDRAGVADAQAARIAGFPHLRVNRLLASFRDELTAAQRPDWLARLRALAATAEVVELANLPPRPATWQALGVADRHTAAARLADCGDHLLATDRAAEQNLVLLRDRTRVADAYQDYQRVLGLYPLTALAVSVGVGNLHAETRARFARPDHSTSGELIDYVPVTPRPAAIAELPRDALGIPQPTAMQRERLFARHAPVWRIDTATPADRIGRPVWRDGRIEIVTTQPIVYEKLSYTRWRGDVLLQLNYVIWLPARPKTGPLDLLGGHLDGVTWRVTLAPDGQVLMYDAMHNCGCYHMAFPGPRLEPRERGGPWQEPLITPAAAPQPGDDQRVRIRLATGSHYLQQITAVAADVSGVGYVTADYYELRSLATAVSERRRSLFDERGLVPGSERLERWLLWPMGVPEPGAMRQWGTHATAFVGKRHFDEPFLIQRYFSPE